MNPLVSVIIPNYNHAVFLRQRIDTVLNQTYTNFEIILLDDCSTDGSATLIEQYRHHAQVKHIVLSNTNSGSTFKQWQKGLSLAKGDFIWIAESDDFADVSFLQTAMDSYSKIPGLNLFFCSSARVDDTGTVQGTYDNWFLKTPKLDFTKDFTITGETLVSNGLRYSNVVINASAVVFRKAAIGDFFRDHYGKFKYCGDWYFWADVVQGGIVTYTAARLNYFRFHQHTTRAVKPLPQQIEYYLEMLLVQILMARKFGYKPEVLLIDKYIGAIINITPAKKMLNLLLSAGKKVPSLTPLLMTRFALYKTLKKMRN